MSLEEQEEETQQGSWTPMIVILVLILLRWIVYGQGTLPVRLCRWYNMKVRRHIHTCASIAISPPSHTQTCVTCIILTVESPSEKENGIS